MSDPASTRIEGSIHNPGNPHHFMRLQPITGRIRIRANGQLLAESTRAIRMTEIARDIYGPSIYVPEQDITAALVAVPDKSTHCPLKGDAHYFALSDQDDAIAWTYDRPLDFAQELRGLVSFYPSRVTIEEAGVNDT